MSVKAATSEDSNIKVRLTGQFIFLIFFWGGGRGGGGLDSHPLDMFLQQTKTDQVSCTLVQQKSEAIIGWG